MSNIHIVEHERLANVITSAGYFTPSIIFSIAVLSHILGEINIYRTTNTNTFTSTNGNVITLDLYDNTKYSHNKDYGCRENGISYSLGGLIWKDFGMSYCNNFAYPNKLFSYLDIKLFQEIDFSTLKHSIEFFKELGFSEFTENSKEDFDTAFLKACNLAVSIFDTQFNLGISKLLARKQIENALNSATSNYLVLNSELPWKEILLSSSNPKASEIEFVIFCMKENRYLWKTVPNTKEENTPRRPVPNTWLSSNFNDDFSQLTGVSGALYCHYSGTYGETSTLEAAKKLIDIATQDTR